LKWPFKRFRREQVVVEDISLILKATRFAAYKHRNQRRSDKSASPYLNHPIAVADALWSVGGIHDINTIASAILHDTVEHTKTSLEELEAEFGKPIASIVREVTDEKRLWKQARRGQGGRQVESISMSARQIIIAEKISNIETIINSPPANWSHDKLREYIAWMEEVITAFRGTDEKLEQHFDQLCIKARRQFERKRKSEAEDTDLDVSNVVGAIRCKFAASGNPADIPNLRGGAFKAQLVRGGIEVDNLGSQPFLAWAAFQAAVSVLRKNGGRAKRGNAMGSRLGEPDLTINSVEGYVAQIVYGKRVGETVFRRITPIVGILIWAGICEHAPNELILQDFE
jgi:guanosine-3',5'-bis(diphosphate) 3'-pyrophosphohydrolase